MKAILLIITTALLMIACGPTYNVKHTYTLPESKDIKICVLQCRSIELQCEQNELLKDQLCNNSSLYIGSGYHRKHHSHFGIGHSFPLSNACYGNNNCKAAYNNCYQLCGGEVKTERFCVKGCPPPKQ